ncbi:sialidase family protein [Arundinibacter roseus]|uniref:Sialidase n=1 Tax=Arundinibacter roseus TaxID=2070510 RepID=A0A4R4KLW2_9BACT|nr:sialidase family protein [Arundinibacter roseus]TDB67976.1 sialidase [Arundinibacter roseus]
MLQRFSFFLCLFALSGAGFAQPKATLITQEFIFENPPVPSCHASTIVEVTPGTWMAAWFGGTEEGNKDVGIWLASQKNGTWSKPLLMDEGIMSEKLRYPCWNPVLFKSQAGVLFLFYKVGPSPREWWGMVRTSTDNGANWSKAERLPDGVLGPIKNKPTQLANGTILSPSSTETKTSWKAHIERSEDGGKTWTVEPIDHKTDLDVIQGSILTYPGNRLQMLCRSKQNQIAEVWSEDGGKTWGTFSKTHLLNPNSGTDAVTLKNGWQVLIYNPTIRGKDWDNGRQKLHVAVSKDGMSWADVHVLENQPRGEYSYPAVVQAADGNVHITYTWERRKVRHVVLALDF